MLQACLRCCAEHRRKTQQSGLEGQRWGKTSGDFLITFYESRLFNKVETLVLIYAFLRRLFSKSLLSTSWYQVLYQVFTLMSHLILITLRSGGEFPHFTDE